MMHSHCFSFQSTLPARGATVRLDTTLTGYLPFQSTLPARGATSFFWAISVSPKISIHAPREGSDLHSRRQSAPWGISIHAPREGSDRTNAITHAPLAYFNPRSPRGERLTYKIHCNKAIINFNPRSPRGERHIYSARGVMPSGISIHAPREGSDPCSPVVGGQWEDFNPRSPRGERPTHGRTRGTRTPFQSTLPARGATPAPLW